MIELIPVIEIDSPAGQLPIPKGPSWEQPAEWIAFRQQCDEQAGYPEAFNYDELGSRFVPLTQISEANLLHLIRRELAELYADGKDEETGEWPVMALYGGFTLKVDGQTQYRPQCCGRLKDIAWWEKVVQGLPAWQSGHPEPEVRHEADWITFDFNRGSSGPFVPLPPQPILRVRRDELRDALAEAQSILADFARWLQQLNERYQLGTPNLDWWLIYERTSAEES